ncbi:tetratricopeptide repeat protein [Actinophytocola sp. KF-1]
MDLSGTGFRMTVPAAHPAGRDGGGATARDLDAVRERLGIDHTHTLVLAHNMVLTLNEHGHTEAARDLARDTLARRRRVLGEDDFRTLRTARVPGERPVPAR